MDYLPLHFRLQDQTVLVVGGGAVAERKVDLLLRANAGVRLVAPVVSPGLRERLSGHEIMAREYQAADIEGVSLVIAATDDPELNERVSADARRLHIPVNVVDAPALCTVIFPAIVDRSPLLLSIGSSGTSPVLARYIRTLIEGLLPEGINRLAHYLEGKRPWLKKTYQNVDLRRRVTERFLASPGRELATAGQFEAADRYLQPPGDAVVAGEVFIVGAGPGDPDLLTLKALQALQQADVILHDNLVSTGVLNRARRDARKEYVGKLGGGRATDQKDINERLIQLAGQGHRVVRLKGGDPFIFGRGGEETEALIAGGVPFQVIPGITAASGCAAYAGIPLTHRDHAQSVRFLTGHPKDGRVDLPWRELVSPGQTLVFYMGLGGLGAICQNLMSHGLSAGTPVAIVSKGTTPEQKVVRGNLETIGGLVARMQIDTPTLIIVGSVVDLRRQSGTIGDD